MTIFYRLILTFIVLSLPSLSFAIQEGFYFVPTKGGVNFLAILNDGDHLSFYHSCGWRNDRQGSLNQYDYCHVFLEKGVYKKEGRSLKFSSPRFKAKLKTKKESLIFDLDFIEACSETGWYCGDDGRKSSDSKYPTSGTVVYNLKKRKDFKKCQTTAQLSPLFDKYDPDLPVQESLTQNTKVDLIDPYLSKSFIRYTKNQKVHYAHIDSHKINCSPD